MKPRISNPFRSGIASITATITLGCFSTPSAQAQTLLFRDDFTRANSTDLNASTAGQSGALSPMNWVEIQCDNGAGATELGDASIVGNQLRLDAVANGGSGVVVYPDQNFTGLTSLTVTMNIDSGGSGGNGRATGFGIGYTKSELDGKTSASLSALASGSDVFIAYDTVGASTSLTVRDDNSQVFTKPILLTPYPVEYSIVFAFADMSDGTAITYEVFENGSSIYNGSTTWTGTDQNYIGSGSNYTLTTDIEYIEIQGTLPAAPEIVKADNIDDLNLGTSWVGGFAPASGELAVWDNTVTAANSTVLGGDLTWGGITIQDPIGSVTISGVNTLTLDDLTSAIDLSAAAADLSLNCGLVMTGSDTWDVASGRTLSVGGSVSGSLGVTKLGDGAAILSGANDYAGSTSVTAGTLQLGASEVIPHGGGGAASGNITVDGTLDLNTFSESLNGLSGAGVIDTVAGGTPTLTVGYNGQNGTFNGILQNTAGTLNLTKFGVGTLTLGGANTYSGTTTVSGGTLQVSNLSALGNTTGVSLAGGTTLVPDLDGFAINVPITLGAADTSSFIGVPIDGGTMNINNVISGDADLVFTDLDTFGANSDGIIVLGAANIYTGDTVIGTGDLLGNNTIIRSGISNALPTTTVLSLEGLAGQGSGREVIFDLNGNDQTLAGLKNVVQEDRKQFVTSSGAATLTVNNVDDFSFGGSGGGNAVARIEGAISLVKSGAGTFSLTGTNTNTGNTSINEGELRIGDGGTLGALNPVTDITVASGATFGVNRSNAVIQGTDFSSNPISGDGSFAQLGTGSTTLNVANTYNGTTTVDAGAVVVQHAEALGSTAAGTVVNGTGSSGSANARLDLSGGVTVTGEALTISGSGSFLGALTSSSGSNVWAGPVTIAASGTRLGASAGASLEVSGVIDSGAVETGLIIRPNDLTASVILSGANTYLGNTQVVIGKLQLDGGDNRLPTGTTLLMSSSGTNPDAEFDLNGRNQEVAGLAITGSGVDIKNSVNNSSVTPSSLTVNTPTGAPSTFAGILKGNLAITKTGPEALSLTGTSNEYTGDTTVNEGILSLGGINPSNESSTVTIADSGATLDLTFNGTDTVDKLFIGTTQQAAGEYKAVGSVASGTELAQLSGTGTLTVTSGPSGGGYSSWASLNGAGVELDGDHDADGVSNGVEYFIGGPNGNTTGFTALPGVTNTGGTLSVTWTHAADYTGVYDTDFVVETSATLVDPWTTETEGVNVIITGDDVTYTFPAGTKNFARLKVTGP